MRIFKIAGISVIFLVIIAFSHGDIVVTAEEGDTVVSISPSSSSVSTGDNFNINVSCIPSQPVKAFEFRLYFDASLLQVDSIAEGDIFDGYNTFFNPGTIDNVAGSITNVFSLIIGQGNVSDNGSLITITFTAKQNSGTSSLNFESVGVTDEFGYIPVDVFDGSVTVLGSGGDPPGGGDDFYLPPQGGNNGNNAPETPITPIGPALVEIGVEYVFETSSFDVDGDNIRLRFDWGDGNLSNWSGFVGSNESVSMSYFWTNASSFEVKAIAQDENGLNSSWSLPLNVTVSQASFGGNPPFADIGDPGYVSANETIVFDASGSFDVDGFIVSYYWDFGDGENGSGLSTSHMYRKPGEYLVTLIVTDNDGNEYSTSLLVTVSSDVDDYDENRGILPFPLSFVIIGILTSFLISLTIFFRDKIKVYFSTLQSPQFSNTKKLIRKSKIKRIDEKIQKIKKSF